MAEQALTFNDFPFLARLGLKEVNQGCFNGTWCGSGSELTTYNPSNGKAIAKVIQATEEDYESCVQAMTAAKKEWMETPAPKRGEVVRQIGLALREHLDDLGSLVALEMGKIKKEGVGEVQEFIDICDYAVGLSRSMEGKVIPSERPGHFMLENWNPLGLIGIITAFNFPCAVAGWNLGIAMICGDLTVWKGASTTPLVSIAVTKIVTDVLEKNGYPSVALTMVTGPGRTVGEMLINDSRLQLISFTGSTSIGKRVSTTVHSRFGRTILELGGNNAAVIMDDADLELAYKGLIFAAVGTAGQRCTSLRRLLIHEKVYDSIVEKLLKAYPTIQVGASLEDSTLLGPVHNEAAVTEYLEGIEEIKKQGGKVLYGGKRIEREGTFVEPCLVEIDGNADIVKTELFVPILYLIKIKDIDQAIEMQNNVPQGLSSSLFTKNLQHLFKWMGPSGSDCGIVNTNIGPSGAEIGGAFGGEKETGGGREAGSDSWKQYMRRATCCINFSDALPLAQGIKFDV
mmetsp:Transcript_62453/g.71640  ORF Transcript_62453/g.71640 Transcript_62453/m.71640 type:complete len:513 (+) Transcript_62453:70-1608(+)